MADDMEKARSDEDDLFLAEESDEDLGAREAEPWKILIVDDDLEVHEITQLVLKRYAFAGRSLHFLNAYSGREAKDIIARQPDVALVLLDVVMETEHSGLEVARHIRDELGNAFVRIILRTGQPGQAPENQVIMEYDINDYKEKTELTAKKLFTTITAALRSYRDLRALDRSRAGLRQIVESSACLFEPRSLKQFAAGLLTQFTAVFHLDETALYAQNSGFAAAQNGDEFRVLAATGQYAQAIDRPVREVVETNLYDLLRQAAEQKKSLFSGNQYIGFFQTQNGSSALLFFKSREPLSQLDRELLQVFETNVAIAFDNLHLNQEIIDTQKEVVFTLGEVLESRSKNTAQHVRRVAESSHLLALKSGMSPEEADLLKLAAPLHDIGKIAISDAILNKPSGLTMEEFETIKTHSQIGNDILKSSPRRILKAAATITRQHHERWDGQGYPQGLKEEEIHIYSRITAIADVFDALAHKRDYKDAWGTERIFEFFREEQGKHFDPNLVEVFLENQDEFLTINETYPD